MVLAIFRTYIAYILRKLKIRHLGAPFYEVIEVFSLKQKYAYYFYFSAITIF